MDTPCNEKSGFTRRLFCYLPGSRQAYRMPAAAIRRAAAAAARPAVVGRCEMAAYPKAPIKPSQARPAAAAPMRTISHRLSRRENTAMEGVSQDGNFPLPTGERARERGVFSTG